VASGGIAFGGAGLGVAARQVNAQAADIGGMPKIRHAYFLSGGYYLAVDARCGDKGSPPGKSALA
jgi:hypothetical protein